MARFLRFYCPELPEASDAAAELSGDEAQHLAKVLRLGPGVEVTLFDGLGRSAVAVVDVVARSKVTLRLVGAPTYAPAPRPLTIAVAPPKRDLDEALSMLCELGVPSFLPIQSRHGEVLPTDPARQSRYLDRLRKLSIAAAKQCGSDHLLRIEMPTSVAKLSGEVFVCDPAGTVDLAEAVVASAAPVIAIGPEGGWSDAERELFTEKRWPLVRVPGRVLRTRTAAVVAASIAIQVRGAMAVTAG